MDQPPKAIVGAVFVALVLVANRTSAAPTRAEVNTTAPRRARLAPLAPNDATRSHAPYESGRCGLCHVNKDASKPGPIRHASVNEQCFECHDDMRDVMSRKYKHAAAVKACTECHNAHDSIEPALLSGEMVELCLSCHVGMRRELAKSKTRHEALTKDRKCSNCHNPHAVSYDVRLLVAEFPAELSAPYEPARYALCFGCHNEKMVAVERTTTLTGFRAGSRNLHYAHVNRGRHTCRVCHEVHASRRDHEIRERAPYGAKGSTIELGYRRLSSGGSCAKVCHDARKYDNKTLTSAGPARE